MTQHEYKGATISLNSRAKPGYWNRYNVRFARQSQSFTTLREAKAWIDTQLAAQAPPSK